MVYIAIVGPMGSGKTTLARELNKILNYEYLEDICHTVFNWPQYFGKHADPTLQAPIQSSMIENHFHQIFGHFLIDKNKHTIADSAYIEHAFYNDTKFKIGKYDSYDRQVLEDKHYKLWDLLPEPDILIRVRTSPEQTVKNIINRNRYAEDPNRDTTKLLGYITVMTEEYNKSNMDIDYEFNSSVATLAEQVIGRMDIG